MSKSNLTNGMVSFLGRWRQWCVTKEKCEELYQKGGSIDNQLETITSIGNDLEDILVNIKRKKVKNQAFSWNQQVYSFHLSLLTQHEKKKLEMVDESFLSTFTRVYSKRNGCYGSPDVSKEEMEASESKQKYALSTCSRCTFVLSVHLRQSDEITEDVSSDESLSEQLQFGYDWVFSE